MKSGKRTTLVGGSGDDTLTGGLAVNVFVGGAGNDNISGYAGDDLFYADDNQEDTLNGGTGTDRADADADDDEFSIEGDL